MNTTIVVTENIKLEFTKGVGSNVGTYSPLVFRKGGEEYYNPRTSQKEILEDKWVSIPLWFTNLVHALRWCAQEGADSGGEVSLTEYISKCEKVWNSEPVHQDKIKTKLAKV
jgi:hypothetical protein